MSRPLQQASHRLKTRPAPSVKRGEASGAVVTDKPAKGAGAVRKAEREAATADAIKLDGTLATVVNEIQRLHNEIVSAARTSLSKAIRIGELLCRVRASRRGKWILWIKKNAPFSERTARNYIACFKRRGELQSANVADLSSAYALLCGPTRTTKSKHQQLTALVRKQAEKRIVDAKSNDGDADVTHMERESVLAETQSGKWRKSQRRIMKEISSEYLNADLRQSQMEIDRQLSDIIAQIGRQDHAEWPEFSDRLKAHAAAFQQQGERLSAA
jgi:DUF3102 family protein